MIRHCIVLRPDINFDNEQSPKLSQKDTTSKHFQCQNQ